MGNPGRRPHILEQAVPEFINCIDSDPLGAWRAVHEFCWKLLVSYPPPVFRDLSKEAREDITANIVLKLCQDNFRALRKYQDRGLPFAAWVARIARNLSIDCTRSRRRPKPDVPVRPVSRPDDDAAAGELREIIGIYIRRLRVPCQVLLSYGSHGFTPRQIAQILRIPGTDGKKISDSLRACRNQLRKMLVDGGHTPGPPAGSRRNHAHA